MNTTQRNEDRSPFTSAEESFRKRVVRAFRTAMESVPGTKLFEFSRATESFLKQWTPSNDPNAMERVSR